MPTMQSHTIKIHKNHKKTSKNKNGPAATNVKGDVWRHGDGEEDGRRNVGDVGVLQLNVQRLAVDEGIKKTVLLRRRRDRQKARGFVSDNFFK